MYTNISKYVSKICAEKNISKEELAKRLGISPFSAYNTYLLGNHASNNMTVKTILNIAQALEVSPDIIFHLAVKDSGGKD